MKPKKEMQKGLVAMKPKTLKINDKVNWCGAWGTEPSKVVKVVAIERCKSGEKNGVEVEKISWTAKNFVVTLDNGHWAYAHQISPITL